VILGVSGGVDYAGSVTEVLDLVSVNQIKVISDATLSKQLSE
jgi:hypothetical protein